MEFNPNYFKNEVVVGEGFFDFFEKISKMDIHIPADPEPVILTQSLEGNNAGAKVEDCGEPNMVYSLNVFNGCTLVNDDHILISAYDESINKYSTLQGKAIYVSHSLVFLHGEKYYPVNKLTTLFVTKSNTIAESIPNSILAEKWDVDTTANVEIAEQKKNFISEYCCDNSLLLIDGPFLAGDGYTKFKGIIKERFLDHNVVPIFIVKNSNTSLITDNYDELKGKYNSDLHWSNELLKPGQRTKFFKYTDEVARDNSKVFCYLKFYEGSSPIRIEIPTNVYYSVSPSINSFMDMIYYLIIEQGNFNNPQARPIAVAEMFARETLKLINFKDNLHYSNFTPTMNEKRGMEYDG